MITCLACSKASLRAAGKLARHGAIYCPHEHNKHSFPSANWPRECERFHALPAEKYQERKAWLDKQ